MDTTVVSDVLRDGMVVAIKLAGPMLILSMLVGVIVAILKPVTQIHDQTIGFILKLAVIATVLMIGGGWMLETLLEYARELFALIAA